MKSPKKKEKKLHLPVLLSQDRKCQRCDLHHFQKHPHQVCIGSRYLVPPKKNKKVVFILGEKPGIQERSLGQSFVGETGELLTKGYVQHIGLDTVADIYAGNVIRCWLPGNRTPSLGQVKKCQGYWLKELFDLSKQYEEVVILCVGGKASSAVRGKGVKECLKYQGHKVTLSAYSDSLGTETQEVSVTVFYTFHPASLVPGRSPWKASVVEGHLNLLYDYLSGTSRWEEIPEFETAPKPPPYTLTEVALDIETHGCLVGYRREYSHPVKTEAFDKVARTQMVKLLSLSWMTPEGEYKTAVFHWDKHRLLIRSWMNRVRRDGALLIFKNYLYDLSYLRYCDPYLEKILKPYEVRIWDTDFTAFLLDPEMDEKSLKAQSIRWGVANYEASELLSEVRYTSEWNPDLWKYAGKDAYVTLRLHHIWRDEIARKFPGSDKLSPYSYEWFTDAAWTVYLMQRDGLCVSVQTLRHVRDRLVHQRSRIEKLYRAKYGANLRGKGSQTFLDKTVFPTFRDYLPRGVRLAKSDVTEKVSTGIGNINILLEHCDPKAPYLGAVRLLALHRKVDKMLSTYFTPRLERRANVKKGQLSHRPIDSILYSRNYVVPQDQRKGSSSAAEGADEGGVNQGRWVNADPATVTDPPIVQQSYCSRFKDGLLLYADLRQIEPRIQALLSGDPVMMWEFESGVDLHGESAKMIFGDDVVNRPTYKGFERQLGKTFRLSTLYLGEAYTARNAAMRDMRVDLPMEFWQEAIEANRVKYEVSYKYQMDLVAEFQSEEHDGHLHVPSGIGHSKFMYGAEPTAIVNTRVQCLAALTMQAAVIAIRKEIEARGMRSVIPLVVYDAVYIDSPPEEEEINEQLVDKYLRSTPFFEMLCKRIGRRVPLDYELKKIRRTAYAP